MKKILFKIYDRLTKNMGKWRNLYTESMNWSYDELRFYQLKRLFDLYGIKSWTEFYDRPLTTKKNLRKFKPNLSGYKDKELTCHYTSGSTGEPLKIWGPAFIQSIKPAIFERGWRRVGWNGKDWILRLTNGKPEWKIFDWLRNVKPMNYKAITQKNVGWIIKHRPFLIHGGSGAIRELTTLLKQTTTGIRVMNNMVVQLMSEDTREHAKVLKKYYKYVYSGYGCHELSTVASPCGEGVYFVNMETCICEVINNEIVVTDLWNNITPVIRYRTKDYGKLYTNGKYGTGHEILVDIRGRAVDYYDGPDTKKPLGWWILGPISHRPDIIKTWKIKVIPKKKKLILYVVWKKKPYKLWWYKRWIKKEAGLNLEIVERKRILNKQRVKLLEVVK